MITLTVGGKSHTSALEDGTLCIRSYGALRSSFRATLHYNEIPDAIPKVGQEILLSEDGSLLWGGILVEAEQICHSTESFTMTLRGQGYEQILQRYCLPGIELEALSPSEATRVIFTTYLDPIDRLRLGTVDDGLTQKFPYRFYPAKASSVFDHLAKENGFVWWINKNKTFSMRSALPMVEQAVSIDLTGIKPNRLEDLQTFIYRASTAECKNVQYVYNKLTDIEGIATKPLLISEMSNRYGGGQYGASAINSVVTNEEEAETVANQMLLANPGLGEIEFTTDSDVFALGQIVDVTAPVCGINKALRFCVTEIRAVYFCNRFRYTVIARESDTSLLSATAWETILAKGSAN